MCRQEPSGDLDHVRLPLLAETNLEYHKVVEVVCSLKDIHETIDAALLTSCPSGIKVLTSGLMSAVICSRSF